MQRIRQQWQAEAINFALGLLDPDVADVIESTVDFFAGDPIFSGIHDELETFDGRSYRTTAHACYPYHQNRLLTADRKATVVLPESDPWNWYAPVLVHEIGHIIHYVHDFEDFDLPVVTAYAGETWCEKFAEAFTAHYMPLGWGYGEAKSRLSPDHIALLEDVAGYSSVWER